MTSNTPRLSVITATLNRSATLEACLESVAAQRDVDIEQIVIDGGSEDGSVEILGRWNDKLAYWRSGRDGGIASAMNLGLEQARGEWVLFLHADDALHSPESIATAMKQIATRPDIMIAGFPVLFGTAHSGRIKRPRGATSWLRIKTGFLHQGTLIRRILFDEIGMHDESLAIAMDYDFFLRAWVHRVPSATFDDPVLALVADTGVSSRQDPAGLNHRFAEERKVQLRYASRGWRAAYGIYWTLYPMYRRLLAKTRIT